MSTARLRVEPLAAVEPGENFAQTWDRCARAFGDIYYERGYLAAAALNEAGPIELALLEHGNGTVLYPFVRRPLEMPKRFDLITPYEYGGPLAIGSEESGGRTLLQGAFAKSFSEWCRDVGVVSEFVRFHPVIANQRGAEQYYEMKFSCGNVVIDLAQSDEEFLRRMEGSTRRSTMTAIRRGCRAERLPYGGNSAATFGSLYRARMDRLGASGPYYFTDAYFAALLALGDSAPLLAAMTPDDTIVGVASFVAGMQVAHYHLSGSLAEHATLNANNLLILAAAQRFRESGRRWLHLGGAAASQTGLLAFKQGFSPERRDYYVGSRIFDVAAYRALCAARDIDPDSAGHFPAYRRSPSARDNAEEIAHAGAR